jgi:hypothetical protein
VASDLRRYARQTNIRLLIGFVLVLLIVGGGLIAYFYGVEGAILGLVCLLAAVAPIGLIWALLAGAEWIVKKNNG